MRKKLQKKQDTLFYQLLYSLRLGDGCYYTRNLNSNLLVNSTNLDYLTFKKRILDINGIFTYPVTTQLSGYTGRRNIFTFTTRVDDILTSISELRVSDILKSLNKIGLIMFYLDDGSLHKHRYFGHLYCNSFASEDVDILIDIFYKLYPIKKCAKRVDRKKDGRTYPYIYIPVPTMKVFARDVKNFLKDIHVKSLLYKCDLPSQTIERV